ncbi:hypothetical protein [Desulfolithobacter sp.]
MADTSSSHLSLWQGFRVLPFFLITTAFQQPMPENAGRFPVTGVCGPDGHSQAGQEFSMNYFLRLLLAFVGPDGYYIDNSSQK